jgi:invasion protein IalB
MLQSSRCPSALGGAFRTIGAVAVLMMGFATLSASPASAAEKIEKTFGKWDVVCVDTDKEPKACVMRQTVVAVNKQTGRRAMVLRWAISTNKNHEQTQQLLVPVGVSIKEGVRLFLGAGEPIVIPYDICGPRICIAKAPLDAKGIAAIKAGKKVSVSYVRGNKKLQQLDLDLNGFSEAYDFLTRQVS